MKTLMLVRHAKAVRGDMNLPDRDRDLEEKGVRNAKKLAKYLASEKVEIDLLVSSPANRAKSTALILTNELGKRVADLVIVERLYGSDVQTLVSVVEQTSKKVDTLMLVGHNPQIEGLANFFLSKDLHMQTSSLIILKFNVDTWEGLGHEKPVRFSSVI